MPSNSCTRLFVTASAKGAADELLAKSAQLPVGELQMILAQGNAKKGRRRGRRFIAVSTVLPLFRKRQHV